MPDPLLAKLTLHIEIKKAEKVALRHGAKLSNREQAVFLETLDATGHKMVARIDCSGYPDKPLDVEFLDPLGSIGPTVEASNDCNHWPMNALVMNNGKKPALCLAGIRSYMNWHPDPGYILSLPDLVSTLILCCKGNWQLLDARHVPVRAQQPVYQRRVKRRRYI